MHSMTQCGVLRKKGLTTICCGEAFWYFTKCNRLTSITAHKPFHRKPARSRRNRAWYRIHPLPRHCQHQAAENCKGSDRYLLHQQSRHCLNRFAAAHRHPARSRHNRVLCRTHPLIRHCRHQAAGDCKTFGQLSAASAMLSRSASTQAVWHE